MSLEQRPHLIQTLCSGSGLDPFDVDVSGFADILGFTAIRVGARRARANQSVEVDLPTIDASADGLRILAIAFGAANVHLPAKASRHPQCLDFR